MPLATLLLPPVLLVASALVGWALERAGVDGGRPAGAAGAWAAIAVLAAGWFAAGRTPLEQSTGTTIAGAPLILRFDAVTVLFWLAVLVPAALLLTFQRRSPGEAGMAALATAATLGALAAGSLVVAAFGLATSVSLVLVLLCQEEPVPTPSFWAALTAAWLLLAWTAVLLQSTAGTSAYGAVPVTALSVPLLALLALAALLGSGLVPWRTWVSAVWERRRLEAGTLAVALLAPLGFAPLVRAYGMGGGQLPSAQAGLVLCALGTAAALGAAIRAQAASSRRGVLAEAVPFAGGMALLALGLGTPLGMVAALTGLAGIGAAAAVAPLAADRSGPLSAVAIATLAGVPPALPFGAWLLGIQAAVEAGEVAGFLGLALAAAWLLMLAAAARAARLPLAPPDADGRPTRAGDAAAVAVALAGGVGLTALMAFLTIPAAAEVMPPAGRSVQSGVSAAAILNTNSLAVSTASGGWSAALLGGPLIALGLVGQLVARALARRRPVAEPALRVVATAADAEPLFPAPLTGVPERVAAWVGSLSFPEQYRSIFQPSTLARAAVPGSPWLWIAATVALAIAVTR
jgi:hypothetical protein